MPSKRRIPRRPEPLARPFALDVTEFEFRLVQAARLLGPFLVKVAGGFLAGWLLWLCGFV